MFVGFRINHFARILETVVAVVTLGGLLTPGGRSVARGVAKGAAVTAKEVSQSWRARREQQGELRRAAQRDEMMRQMYERDPGFRAAVDKAFVKKSWWTASRGGANE